ncbi:type III secretion system YopJ family effector RipAE [Ralstonia pseudosolanacearum]|uniref:type III secretion system YopJ family effector RipAE n=1 Tax=Ralstonia pseudosolanacearum TaxID=1310165 RepID=UPI00267606A9|nr:type III secretion system YopJ family effector RipAE [Ralstonia pseudosolanacearum]MDO3507195.1 type III secretion system YopJ family effector RipAE [Ralstonia pseudosolanacearum]MDO3606881.1 type III secretion system YopJ family effector RipAE [Ralstonia pseudosolanacearum]MDO3611382.1 type III secretion system YopJ family effector RipAE [Ralstonia pseudosolanacearum]MDO3621549.1 type III secretion system YopJ family effector RipAE [Ralstonia pseudosolanacearum]
MLKTRITPATQPASTSTVAHPNSATGSQTQPPQVSGPRARTADRNFTNLPTRHAGARALKQPVKLTRAASKVDTRALAAAAIQPGLSARLESMRQYLAELKTAAHAAPNLRVETPGHRDAEFLDLLVAVENARHPKLALSAHTISLNTLNTTNPAAVASLARNLETSMRSREPWHAVVDIGGHAMALSVRHHPEQPKQISMIVVNSAGEHLSVPEWNLMATLLAGHLNHKLEQAGDPKGVRIVLHCLNTGIQKTNHGGAIFALSAVKAMPGDEDIGKLHAHALSEAGKHADAVDVHVIDETPLLGPRFFKHMTHTFGLERMLTNRPDLRTAPVNKKTGLPLAQYQSQHLRPHRLLQHVRETSSTSYEDKRLQLYERAITHLASARVEALTDHLDALRRARKGKADMPAPRDAEFLDLLVEVENKLDPQLRLSAHKIDAPRLAVRDPGAIASLAPVVADGVRGGGDWHATLNIGDGHHVAVAARHDAAHPTHVSLAVLDGAGSPFSPANWRDLASTVAKCLDAAGNGRTGKVWLTYVDASSQATASNSALFALRATKEMKESGLQHDGLIDQMHKNALNLARSAQTAVSLGKYGGPAPLDPEYGTGGGADRYSLDGILRQEHIKMYKHAIRHFERAKEPAPERH